MIFEIIANTFSNFRAGIPEPYKLLFDLSIYTILIAIYAVFIWKFYKFLARREILDLNLNQYNHSNHPKIEKFIAILLFTIEYMVILPFLVLFWFTVLSLFLLLLSENQSAHEILLIYAAIIASIRITSYISTDLSKDLAKIFPFTVLGLFVLNPNFFNTTIMLEKITQIPGLFNNIIVFIIFIFGVEFVLRGVYSITQLWGPDEDNKEEMVAKTK